MFSRSVLVIIVAVVCGCAMLSPSEATVVTHDAMSCAIVTNATCPDDQFVKFILFTRINPNTSQFITMETDNLLSTNFKAANPTKIIIHGHADNYTNAHMIYIGEQYLLKEENNVIMVDWSRLTAKPHCYLQSLSNMEHVSECMAMFIQRLRSVVSDIHVLGFSLGAHIAGRTANILKPYRLPKITGMDPAGPMFEEVVNDQRLDSTDAIFVEVLHTNVFEFGTNEPSGHVDYYFNGGTNQPGCGLPVLTLVCSHTRSVRYYAESLNSVEGFYGWQCSSFFVYFYGFCWQQPRVIRLGDVTNRGIVSVPTGSASPFALGQ